MLIGGLLWAAVHLWEWQRWRTGRLPRLPWLNWPGREAPRTEMNRIVEAAGAIGNAVLGLVVALMGLALISAN